MLVLKGNAAGRSKLAPKSPYEFGIIDIEVMVHCFGSLNAHLADPIVF